MAYKCLKCKKETMHGIAVFKKGRFNGVVCRECDKLEREAKK